MPAIARVRVPDSEILAHADETGAASRAHLLRGRTACTR